MASASTISSHPPRPGGIQLQRLRAIPASRWATLAFGVMCVLAVVGYFAFPTYPTYDSFYALLWGRDLLHLHTPDFSVYRGPTEHPLAIAFGVFCSLFGQGGARLMVFGSIASFVALVAGVYRVGRLCFGPVVGALAGLLVLSRFFVENLAAQGYLDISYVALVVWATALEIERPRRGPLVFLLLAAAGLLRPDAWLLSAVYWLWCAMGPVPVRPARLSRPIAFACRRPRARRGATTSSPLRPGHARHSTGSAAHSSWDRPRPADNPTRLRYLALAAIAPVLWLGMDALVTGNPLYSLHSTSGLAAELGRTEKFSEVLSSTWSYAVRIDKLPVVLGAIAGALIAIWLAPRRVLVPFVVLAGLLFVFIAEGSAGASVVDRYMVGAAIVMLVFCALAIGGWSMLEHGTVLRRVWMLGAALLVLYGGVSAARTLSLSSLRTTLAYHEDFHEGLAAALHSSAVSAQLKRCSLLSLPNNKLIPDARWSLDSTGQSNIVARSQASADALKGAGQLKRRIERGSVAVYPLGEAVFVEAIVDVGDDPRDQVPLKGFKRVYTSRYYAVYGNC